MLLGALHVIRRQIALIDEKFLEVGVGEQHGGEGDQKD